MKNFFTSVFFAILLFSVYSATAQVNQISIGASNVTLAFNAVKFDSSDGGTINVGYANDPASGRGSDCFLVKLNSSQQVVWQRIIPNTGDDLLSQVIICANGDYVAVGRITESGILRAFACRINKTTGNLIWATKSSNSSIGELFHNVIETTSGNLAISGTDSYATGLTNVFVVLLSSSGNTIWSKKSLHSQADEPLAINQLQNGNLIVGAFDFLGSNYAAIIMELSEASGNILIENSYTINIPAPNAALTLNSLFPISIKIKDGIVTLNIDAFQGSASNFYPGIYTYNQVTKQLTGNLYYHSGDVNSVFATYYPLAGNDFLIAESYSSPLRVYVSRITNGTIIYDRLINNPVTSIFAIDTTATNSVYCGQATYGSSSGTYNLFSPRNVPTSAAACSISNSNSLVLQASNFSPSASSDITFASSNALFASVLTSQASTYLLNSICFSVLPITLINFSGEYNKGSNSNNLSWHTTNEVGTKDFIIERSTDNGLTFSDIGTVSAIGASNYISNYNFTDRNPSLGSNLYRLKQIDLDNNFKYSNIISLTAIAEVVNRLYLTPNPARNYTLINSISSTNTTAKIEVFDASGKLIKIESGQIGRSNPYSLSIKYPPGIYYLKIQSGNSMETLKLVID